MGNLQGLVINGTAVYPPPRCRQYTRSQGFLEYDSVVRFHSPLEDIQTSIVVGI